MAFKKEMGGGGQGRTCIRQMDIVGFFKTKQKSRIHYFFHATPSGTLKQSLTDTTPRIPEATRMTALGGTINCAFVPSLSQSLRPPPTIHIRHIRTAPTLQLQTPHIYTRPPHIPWRRLCRLWTRVWTTWDRDWPVSNCPPSALTPMLRWSAVGAASSAVSGCIHETRRTCTVTVIQTSAAVCLWHHGSVWA